MVRTCPAIFLLVVVLVAPVRGGNTYVGATEADTLFSQITAADMDIIRTKKILIASRSYGQNVLDGIDRLTALNPMYSLDYARNIINRFSDPHTALPTNIFELRNVNHYLCPLDNHLDPGYLPGHAARIDDLEDYLYDAPYAFGSKVDLVLLQYHENHPDDYAYYHQKLAQWQADFPSVKFVYVTSGLALEQHTSDYNEDSWDFGTLVLADHLGVDPVMDWRSLLSTDASGNQPYGHNMCPEFNLFYPSGDNLHPNAPFIEERLGKAFLLVLKGELVPEPATMSLVAAGLLALVARRRKA